MHLLNWDEIIVTEIFQKIQEGKNVEHGGLFDKDVPNLCQVECRSTMTHLNNAYPFEQAGAEEKAFVVSMEQYPRVTLCSAHL